MGARACANLTAMSDRPTSVPKPAPAPREIGRMPLSVFIPENRKAYERAEARRQAVVWLAPEALIRALLKRSFGGTSHGA
jgi:hypothetical protein